MPITRANWTCFSLVCFVCFCLLITGVSVVGGQVTAAASTRQQDGADDADTDEAWEAIFLAGSKVGYGRTLRRRITHEGQECREISNVSRLTVKRFGQSINQEVQLGSVETLEGQLLAFSTQITSGDSSIKTRGHRTSDTLAITTTTQGKQTTAELTWSDQCGGFFAAEESLRRRPLKPGESRQIRSLLPIFNQLSDIRLQAIGSEPTTLLSGSRELLKVRNTMNLDGGQAIESTMWVDLDGKVWKTELAGLGQTTYRTTKAMAVGQPIDGEFDLGDYTIVRVQQLPAAPHSATRAVYRARLNSDNPYDLFVSDASQRVRAVDKKTAEITVYALRPDVPAVVPAAKFTANDLAPSNLVQSDSSLVMQMASLVAIGDEDPWRIAKLLEKHVHDAIRVTGFSQALATAAEVAKSLEGDCTEHAVLLAALCRARKIPARMAIGLVYSVQQQGFAYHMWNEVWIEDRWIPLDATLGRGGIGVGHIKLAVTDLRGATAYSAFVPVFQVLGQLKLEVVEID